MDMNAKQLKLSTGSFDKINTFLVDVGKHNAKCSLHRDFHKEGDGILWALSHGSCLQASYSEEQIEERKRLNAEAPIKNGDVVIIEGAEYVAKVRGPYSDCAIFELA
jgi:hypothetical protein